MKRYLQPGYKFSLNGIDGYFEIKDIIGCGSSCVVYSADFTDKNGICTEHLLKEYNPKTLDIARDESGAIFVDNSDDIDAFEKGLVNFEKGYNIQLEIRKNLETKNTTANIQGIHEGNGTKYIDMTVFNGQTYDKIQENTLFDLLERTKAIAKVIREYHKKGFLHLDIKPNNILTLPETKELVMFFDFDSLLTKGEILSGGSVSYTKSWAAPELLLPGRRSKLCEATDIFSIGEIMFYQIFGRHSSPEERRSFANYEFEPDAEIFKDADQSIFKLLSELFSRTICGVISKRYASADELIEMLDKLLPLANPKRTRIISTLPSVQSFFVGRETEIEEIHGKLQENDLLFVSGMGGIGKSELVKNYANRYKDSYDAIIFAPYVTDFVMLITDDKSVSVANVEMLQGEQLTEYYDRKLRKLNELCNERTLFIIDNYDTTEEPKAVQSLNCKKIITTRFDFADFNVSQIEIGTISARSDVNRIFNEYYGKSLSEEDKITVDKIIDLVDCHTMTVELLAKQMKSGRVTPQKMLEVLTKGGLGESGKEKINAAKDSKFVRQSAYDHIRALFDISGLEENELYVLGNLSLIPHSGILAEQFKIWCGLESYEEINSLENEGWIRRNEEDDIISLHPVVSDIAFELVKEGKIHFEKLLYSITNYLDSEEYDMLPFEKRKEINSMSFFCSERLYRCDLELESIACILNKTAIEMKCFGNLDLCISFAEKAMKISQNIFNPNSAEIAKIYNTLGELYQEKCDIEKAIYYHSKALEIRKKIHGILHHDTAESYGNLAIVFSQNGDFENAEKLSLKALDIFISLYGDKHDLVAKSYNNLGEIYWNMSRFENARNCFLKSLEISTDLHGETNFDTAISYCNLGVLYSDIYKDYSEAEKCCLNALKIGNALFGESYNLIGVMYGNLGSVYSGQGRLNDALTCALKALEISKELVGEIHNDTSIAYQNIGWVYRKKEEYDIAEKYYLRVVDIREKLYGITSLETADAYDILAANCRDQKRFSEAAEYLKKSLDITETICGKNHVKTADVYVGFGSLYREQGDYELSAMNYFKSLKIKKEFFGEESSEVADIYICLGETSVKQSRFEEAEKYFEKAYCIQKKIFGENHFEIATTLHCFSELYFESKMLIKAKEFAEKALKIYNTTYEYNHYKSEKVQKLLLEINQSLEKDKEPE